MVRMITPLIGSATFDVVGSPLDRVARDDVVAGEVGVVDVEEAVAEVVGVERQTEQALLAAAGHQGVDVEEVGAEDVAVALHDADVAALLDHEEAAVAGVGDADREASGRWRTG